jgi:hypothetical protein
VREGVNKVPEKEKEKANRLDDKSRFNELLITL